MFDTIRKHQRLMQFLLLLLVFPAFAFFGVSGYQRFLGDEDTVATVAGLKITRPQFDDALRQQLDKARQILGGRVDASLLDTPSAREKVLDDLIVQRAVLAEAAAKHVSIDDAALRAAILAIPGLRKPDGSFDEQRYAELLSAQGLAPATFEAQMRSDLAMQAIPESVAQSVIVPRTVVDRVLALQEQVRTVRELLFDPAKYAAQVKPTDEQLHKYYDANAAEFTVPENAKIQYLVLDPDAVASQVTINPADLKTYYDQNKAHFGTPEERRASHILIKVDPKASDAQRKAALAKAEEILKQVRAGADFAALAKAQSQDAGSAQKGGDLGWFTRDAMVKPFSDAVWGLKEGEVSGVVQSEFGYHVIKLTGIKPGTVKTFEQARPEIEAELRKSLAAKKFNELASDFSNVVYEQSDSLKPAADRFKLTIQTADGVTRTVGDPKDSNSPLNSPKLLAAIFSADSIKTHRNTEAVEAGANRLVSARVVEYHPAQRKSFDSVKDEVRSRVVAEEARRLAVQAGEAKLKELLGGAAPDGFSAPKDVSRTSQPVVPPAAGEAIFRARTDKLPAFTGADLGAQGYGVYEIVKVTEPAPDLVKSRTPQYAQQLGQVESQQELDSYLASLEARSKVRKYLQRIEKKTEPR